MADHTRRKWLIINVSSMIDIPLNIRCYEAVCIMRDGCIIMLHAGLAEPLGDTISSENTLGCLTRPTIILVHEYMCASLTLFTLDAI